MASGSTSTVENAGAYIVRLDGAEKSAVEDLVRAALEMRERDPSAATDPLGRAYDALLSAESLAPRQSSGKSLSLTDQVAARVREWVHAWHRHPDQNALFRLLRYLAQWRGIVIANTYMNREGAVVFGGLFSGMRYLEQGSQGMLAPRLLGNYEAELHPHFEAILEKGLDEVIDVGCAEGYYAVGLARLAPGVIVRAHDIDENARRACAELARRNGVADRVIIGGEFRPSDFQTFEGRRVLVLVDAEGAEVDILDPAQAPALANMAIVVETHDVYRPGAEALLVERFERTHDITRVLPRPKNFPMPGWMQQLTDLDQLLASWDFRLQPTPWLVMHPRTMATGEASLQPESASSVSLDGLT